MCLVKVHYNITAKIYIKSDRWGHESFGPIFHESESSDSDSQWTTNR